MKKESTKFPAVMTTQSILGIMEGTILQFDWASGKYVSIEEEEDIAEDYFYSGYAIALDPYLVKDNIGTYFTFIEDNELDTKPEQVIQHTVTTEDVKANPGEDLKEGDKIEFPDEASGFPPYNKTHALVIDCKCGARKLLQVVPAPGINITIMAEDETSFLELGCKECGASLRMHFDDSLPYESFKEKSI